MGSSRLQGGRAATVSCGDGSNFLSADQHDAGRLNRPIAGMVSIPIGQSVYPLPPGAILGSEAGVVSNPAMTCNIQHISNVLLLFMSSLARMKSGCEKRESAGLV
jgi:hypothetical protein